MAASDFLAPGAELKELANGCSWTEGPAWLPSAGLFIFSDIKNNRVMGVSEAGELQVIDTEVEFTNGRMVDTNGDLVECSHGLRAIQRRFASDLKRTELLVDSFAEVRLNSPNDLVVRRDGTIFFTDPAYGMEQPGEGHPGEREYLDRWVFRYDEATKTLWPVITDILAPNGLAFSPDESKLYVCDTSSVGGEDGPGHHIRVYDMWYGKFCKYGRTLIEIEDGIADGIRVDEAGRIWSSSGNGVHIFSPEGEELGWIDTDGIVGNLCWGGADGHTLFMCAGEHVLSIRTNTTDATWSWRCAGK